ncbi:hypothetical protein [Halopseudomonas aestusnigri]|uniref:hypothetical protein n=1 Tax=Halopseudomonas aestusnigri TaxID=857252 RepID=UPI003002A0B5
MRLTKVEPADAWHLDDTDECMYFGEYTSGGGFGASRTNQQILNLKKKPTAPQAELNWKDRAVSYWASMFASGLNWEVCATQATFVPIPGSKPVGHPEYDDRLERILSQVRQGQPAMDVRCVLRQIGERRSQHEGERMSPDRLKAQLMVDQAQIQVPLRPTVIVFDDVITKGASFKAAKELLLPLPGVQQVLGLFLAKTVWANPFDDL